VPQKISITTIVWLSLLGVFLAVFPFLHGWPFFGTFISEFRTFNATMFAVWLLVVLSMNLLTGYSGQISLGQAAVVLIGAYTAAVLSSQYSVPLPLAIAIAGLFTGLVGGIVIGIPAVRLSGPYLAIATFALVISLPQILKLESLTRWTNGALGIRVSELQAPGFVDGFLSDDEWLYYVTMATAVFMTILFWNLTHSRIGRAFVALRDSEIGAEQMGVNVPLYKALAFGLSSPGQKASASSSPSSSSWPSSLAVSERSWGPCSALSS
jgi:branched-chain amino acid transport system permease protein